MLALTAFSTNPSKGPAHLHQARALFLEHVPDRALLELRMFDALGVSDALIFQPRIQFGETLHARLGPEQLVAQIADLVLDLTLLPSRCGRARHRLDQVVRAHLQEATIILARLADEDRLHRRLHVVVDATPTNAAIKLERLVMGVEHQLLGLAEVDAHERHAAVRQLHVRRLDRKRQVQERDRFVAPVELIRFSRRKAHRHIGLRRHPRAFGAPSPDEPVYAVVSTIISASAQLFEQTLCRATLPLRGSLASFARISVRTSTHSPSLGVG